MYPYLEDKINDPLFYANNIYIGHKIVDDIFVNTENTEETIFRKYFDQSDHVEIKKLLKRNHKIFCDLVEFLFYLYFIGYDKKVIDEIYRDLSLAYTGEIPQNFTDDMSDEFYHCLQVEFRTLK